MSLCVPCLSAATRFFISPSLKNQLLPLLLLPNFGSARTSRNHQISIWNLHSVEGAFRSEHRVPPAVEDFARGVPSMAERGGGGRIPPSTFLTLYGEHVEQ